VVQVPEGKLPWPHHNPSWTQATYDAKLRDLWVVNNFGLYQGGEDRSSVYLHDGLDVVLDNGTPVYAVTAGTVRERTDWGLLVVEDLDQPGHGWGYAHVNNFVVQVGDAVPQGAHLASVNFQGLEHIHLDRLRLRPGGRWTTWGDLVHLQPDTFFVYTDTEAPVFEGPFRYVRDATDNAFLAALDEPVTVSGDVDIVVGLRDPGEWARSKVPFGGTSTYGDRNAPSRIEYEITGADGTVLERTTSIDFSEVALMAAFASADRTVSVAQTLSIYQHYQSVRPDPPPVGNYNRKFNFFIVTHTGGLMEDGELAYAERGGAWHTAELDNTGAPRFPNGDYVVTVYAYDFKGNMATRSDTVRVANWAAVGVTGNSAGRETVAPIQARRRCPRA
jgi:hypothetical protein